MASNQEVIDLLITAYSMELETVMNYIANSTNLDGVRPRRSRSRCRWILPRS